MKLATIVPIMPLSNKITYSDKIMSLGSCFAVHMTGQLKISQFQVSSNPFGILFHPFAMRTVLRFAIDNKNFTEQDVFAYQEIWSCFDAHSDLNALEQQDIIDALNVAVSQLRTSLQQSNYCLLTFGTAWVYQLVSTKKVVANCHKVAAENFEKRMLSSKEVLDCFVDIINLVRYYNKDMQIIATISPVRHLKDGFVENQASKSLLHYSLQQVLGNDINTGCYYFPSYEIMMDELRDYRYYKKDLVHPNDIALEYIWERFIKACVCAESQKVMKKVQQVQNGLNHIPFNPTASAHLDFLDTLISKIDELLEQYPFMNFR